jgi:hypothetical protein
MGASTQKYDMSEIAKISEHAQENPRRSRSGFLDIIIPTGEDKHDALHRLQYHDTPIKQKHLKKLRGKLLLQHVIDELSESESSLPAKQLGMESCIGSITIVGDRDSLEKVVQQRQHTINYVGLEPKIVANVWKAFRSLFPDSQPLPDIKKACSYLGAPEANSYDTLDKVVRAQAEVIAVVADRIRSGNVGFIPGEGAASIINARVQELIKRNILSGEIDEGIQQITPGISRIIEWGNAMRFRTPESYEFFLDFYDRLEKEVTVLACDTPILNPGFIVFLKQCQKVDADFKMGVTTDTFLTQYYEPKSGGREIPPSVAYKRKYDQYFSGIRRPYMQMERLTRVLNMANVKPNKVMRKETLQLAVDLRKMADVRNWPKMIREVSRDEVLKRNLGPALRAAFYLIGAYCLNSLTPNHSPDDLYSRMSRQVTYERIEELASDVIGGSVKMILSPYGIISIDADHEKDQPAFERHLDKWKQVQHTIQYKNLLR